MVTTVSFKITTNKIRESNISSIKEMNYFVNIMLIQNKIGCSEIFCALLLTANITLVRHSASLIQNTLRYPL